MLCLFQIYSNICIYIYVCVCIYIYILCIYIYSVYIYILFQILFLYRLLQDIECSVLCYTITPLLLSVLNMCVCAKSLQSCLTLCNSVNCSLPGFSVHGILQARILEWVALPSSRGSFRPGDRTRGSYMSRIGRLIL